MIHVIYQISQRRFAVGEVYPEDIRHFVVEGPHREAITLGTDHGLPIYRMRLLTRPVIQGLAFWHYALIVTGRIGEIPADQRL